MFRFLYNNIDFSHKLGTASLPMDDYNKHLHTFNEVLYFVRGTVKYNVESESRTLTEGDLVLVRPGKYHFAEVQNNDEYERYVLKFPDSVLPRYLSDKLSKQGAFIGNVKKYGVLFNSLDSYVDNFSPEDVYTLFVAELTKLLVLLCKEQSVATTHRDDFVSRLVDYIDENVSEPISLDTLSRQLNFSKSYISNEFKRTMKIPVMQYVRYKKIIAAHQMILAGEKKSAVSELFGFKDYSTFYRAYVKVIGHAPTDSDHTHNSGGTQSAKNSPLC